MTVVRPVQPVGDRADRRRGPDHRLSRRSRGSTTGSTAASSSASRRSSSGSTTTACSSASRWSGLAADGRLGAYRHDGFWDCMDTYKDAVTLNDLWEAGEAPWRVWERERGRTRSGAPSLVTGGRGFVGAWLAKALLERGDTGRLVRPRARAGRPALGDRDARDRGRARSRSRATSATPSSVERCSPTTRSTPSSTSPPRRSSAPCGVAGAGLRVERARHLDGARGVPRARRGAGRVRLVGQGVRRARRAALPRGLRAPADRARTRRRRRPRT